MKLGRRECEACERRLTNVRVELVTTALGRTEHDLVGDCPEHGTVPAWITGVRQNRIDELELLLQRVAGPATSWLEEVRA